MAGAGWHTSDTRKWGKVTDGFPAAKLAADWPRGNGGVPSGQHRGKQGCGRSVRHIDLQTSGSGLCQDVSDGRTHGSGRISARTATAPYSRNNSVHGNEAADRKSTRLNSSH